MDHISFAADGAYPTGGTAAFETFVRAAIARGAVDVIAVIPGDCGGYVPVYDRANDKLKVYYGDNNNASDGPLVEVPNTTDLDAVTFNLTILSV
ncbi:MAG TPA: hypothetical protein VFQ76_21490 [Longimicrobiaceae bacterium]|nr:hypothetical protein [Longimicrobiaceae bacterium]